MAALTITARQSIGPDVSFEVSSFGTTAQEIKKAWEMIIGMRLGAIVDQGEENGTAWVIFEHPLANRSNITFFWNK